LTEGQYYLNWWVTHEGPQEANLNNTLVCTCNGSILLASNMNDSLDIRTWR